VLLSQLGEDDVLVRQTVDEEPRAVVFHVLMGSPSHSHPLQFRMVGPDVEHVVEAVEEFRRRHGRW
jgi:hypothetical protein